MRGRPTFTLMALGVLLLRRQCRIDAFRLFDMTAVKRVCTTVMRAELEPQSAHSNAARRPASTTTRYTIDCPPTDPLKLHHIVTKHVTTLDRYLSHRPLAAHTRAAYDELCRQLQASSTIVTSNLDLPTLDIVLDSGCGTGRSSLRLGQLYPDYIVIGVDRSVVRLSKKRKEQITDPRVDYRHADDETKPETEIKEIDGKSDTDQPDASDTMVQHVADNVWLVRAELTDFWRLLVSPPPTAIHWRVRHHYLLYPNPYPKPLRLSSRWYAHAAFPLVWQLYNANDMDDATVVVRSNWYQYLTEFATASAYCLDANSPHHRIDLYETSVVCESTVTTEWIPAHAWTNFEEKYWRVGERTYELTIAKCTTTKPYHTAVAVDSVPISKP